MGFCYLPPDRVKLAMNSKKETNSRVKMGQQSRWVSVIYPLKESKWGFCCLLPDSQTSSEQQERNKQQGQNGKRVKMGFCYLPPERVKLTVNSKKETNSRIKMEQGSRWVFVIYPLKESKWGFCCLPPDGVKLAVNSKKETNSRVNMGKESRLLLFTP